MRKPEAQSTASRVNYFDHGILRSWEHRNEPEAEGKLDIPGE
jgi:hypothetical protein